MVAFTVLFSWPIVVIVLFKRYSVQVALVTSIIAGYLILPTQTGIDLPLLPEINKHFVPSFMALVMAVAITRTQNQHQHHPARYMPAPLPGWLPRSGAGRFLFLLFIGSMVLTVLTNTDPVVFSGRVLRGLRPYDIFSGSAGLIIMVLPFLLARKYLAHPEHHKTLLLILCVAGLLYSLLALYEVRMSPQLNRMVYGFFPHSWLQHFRNGGYRPLVFLSHGLWLGIFFSMTILATLGYLRIIKAEKKVLYTVAAVWLIMTLSVSKTLGAFIITMMLIPLVFLANTRVQLTIASIICVILLLFPVMRSAGYVPIDRAVSMAANIDIKRAASLQFRFDNEDILLDKAKQRSAFGWGMWGRSRVYNERGEDVSVTDGYWVISLGLGGWMRYLAEFGLLTSAILILSFRKKAYDVSLATSTLAVILTANLIDLIPNATLTPVTWLIAGALMGRLELKRIEDAPEPGTVASASASPRKMVYTRQAPKDMSPPAELPLTRQKTRYSRTPKPRVSRRDNEGKT